MLRYNYVDRTTFIRKAHDISVLPWALLKKSQSNSTNKLKKYQAKKRLIEQTSKKAKYWV